MPDSIKIEGEKFEVTDASGVSGTLIWVIDEFVFRVTDDSGEFKDYKIDHHDLPITIDDNSLSSFYVSENRAFIDHNPSVLGLTEDKS